MVSATRQALQIIFIICSAIIFKPSTSEAVTSVLKLKTGVSNLNFTSGDRLKNTPLKSMLNLTPTVLWDFPSFSSRFGVHYLSEINSPYGLTPLSGIGFSAYYHLFGITTGYEFTKDEVLIQKSKPGPYIYLGVTPVNVNLNRYDATAAASENFYFSAFINDISIGMGYDYPFSDSMTFSSEFVLRNGRGVQSTKESVEYSGWTLYLGIATSYY